MDSSKNHKRKEIAKRFQRGPVAIVHPNSTAVKLKPKVNRNQRAQRENMPSAG
jgi:hypothetical protein